MIETITSATIGKNLRAVRVRAGYSQKQLAQQLTENGYKCTNLVISKIECGHRDLPAQLLTKIVILCNCQPAEIMGFSHRKLKPTKEIISSLRTAADILEVQIDD